MTEKQNNEPNLLFFRDTPAGLLSRPPLASSLQHLETSFILVAIGRYPHALVTCGSSIESAIKAAINASPDDRFNFKQLINSARDLYPSFTTIGKDDIKDFRIKRNEIIHFGFSPRDNEISAALLLKTGYILIEQCYELFFQFHLHRKGEVYGGLLLEIDRHLEVAKKVYEKTKMNKHLNLTNCFISFAHQIRWGTQHWMMSDWQKELLNLECQDGYKSWEFQQYQKQKLVSETFKAYWDFTCPVCGGSESFVCELDVNQLDEGKVSLDRGICVECSLVIPNNCPFLCNELCAEQFDEESPKILKTYSIG